jgi:hypothetical protein
MEAVEQMAFTGQNCCSILYCYDEIKSHKIGALNRSGRNMLNVSVLTSIAAYAHSLSFAFDNYLLQ